MGQETAIKIHGKELFGTISGFEDNQRQGDGYEKYFIWPKDIGDGHLYMINLRPGLSLGIGNYFLKENIAVVSEPKKSPISIVFGVTGYVDYTVTHERGRNDFKCFPGYRTISHLPECQNVTTPSPGIKVQYVSILIAPTLLNALMGEGQYKIPASMQDTDDNGRQYYHDYTTITPAVNVIIHQILNCPYQSPLKKIYFESKALELVVHSMESFVVSKPDLGKTFGMRSGDVERVHHARELVKKDLKNPPNLLELGRTVGLSHPKLNFCFREVYGTTIFGYIRNTRLNKAKHLLDEGRMNVTEVAYEVGYSSLSHFAKVFKEHFGIAPGYYLRTVSQKWR